MQELLRKDKKMSNRTFRRLYSCNINNVRAMRRKENGEAFTYFIHPHYETESKGIVGAWTYGAETSQGEPSQLVKLISEGLSPAIKFKDVDEGSEDILRNLAPPFFVYSNAICRQIMYKRMRELGFDNLEWQMHEMPGIKEERRNKYNLYSIVQNFFKQLF